RMIASPSARRWLSVRPGQLDSSASERPAVLLTATSAAAAPSPWPSPLAVGRDVSDVEDTDVDDSAGPGEHGAYRRPAVQVAGEFPEELRCRRLVLAWPQARVPGCQRPADLICRRRGVDVEAGGRLDDGGLAGYVVPGLLGAGGHQWNVALSLGSPG